LTDETFDRRIGHLLHECAPQVLGAVARRHGDFAAAEDAVQEALLAASTQWPVAGIPDNPRGWLYQVALRKMADHVRTEVARRQREDAVATEASLDHFVVPADADIGIEEDDTLLLLFMCCHPVLSGASAIALTLRAVGGLTTAEIANAFLVPEATMAQRISRAKQAVGASKVPFNMPTRAERTERLGLVLHVLYLIFNEGYASSAGTSLHRIDLSDEAIRLTREVHRLVPGEPEVSGLLALMLLTDARRPARTGENGELIPLDEQNRELWNREEIAEGLALIGAASSGESAGPYRLQAAIAAVHDEAAKAQDTDWRQILSLYTELDRLSDNPMVKLNRAIAVGMVSGPAAALSLLDDLAEDARLKGHYRLDAVRAHFFEMSGDRERAVEHYRSAAERTTSIPEHDYLTRKAASVAKSARGQRPP